MTATDLPVTAAGRSGLTQPSAHARSMISTSICLIVTGSWLMPSTHAPSHGAGHRRPVNSGKLFVAWRRSMADCHRSRYTRSFQSGMMLPSGQPLLQNGMPQSMQRAACFWTSSIAGSSCTSCQSWIRCSTGRCGVSTRPCSRNPVTLPIAGPRGEARFERQLEVLREHLHELRGEAVPLAQHLLGPFAARIFVVSAHHALEDFLVLGREPLEVDPLGVHAARERAVDVEHVGKAAAHAGAEVS